MKMSCHLLDLIKYLKYIIIETISGNNNNKNP